MINGPFDNKYAGKATKQRTTRVCAWGVNILNKILTISFIVQVSEKSLFFCVSRLIFDQLLVFPSSNIVAVCTTLLLPNCYTLIVFRMDVYEHP